MTLAFAMLVFYRVLIVIGGILSIYFGYRLFYIDKQTQGDLQIKKGETYELRLRDVAPGVFFALFGALVLTFSLINGLTVKSGDIADTHPAAVGGVTRDAASAPVASGPASLGCASNRAGSC
ncbi:hypothetical protein ACW9YV_07830 [Paraburkholderia strydomiana]